MVGSSAGLCLLVFLTVRLCLGELHDTKKRLLITGPENLQQQFQALQLEIQEMKTKYSELNNKFQAQDNKIQTQEATINKLSNQISNTTKESGSVYIRWGKKTCPGNATLIYSGYTAGSAYTDKGSSASSVCLPRDPIWSSQEPPHDDISVANLYGSEYEFNTVSQHIFNNDVPCAVCLSRPASEVLMIPGRNRCYGNWNEEYSGHLVGPYHNYASEDFLCLDGHPDVINGGAADQDGHVLYYVVSRCVPLQCPPYENGKVITCVVCSK